MDLEGVEEKIDILGLAVFELLQNADLVQCFLDAVVFRRSVDFVVLRVDVDDFQGDYTIILEIFPECARQPDCGPETTTVLL